MSTARSGDGQNLTWKDIPDVAAALEHYYPDVERLDLTAEDLRQLIVALPEFRDEAQPPSRADLDSILWHWMRVADKDAAITEAER